MDNANSVDDILDAMGRRMAYLYVKVARLRAEEEQLLARAAQTEQELTAARLASKPRF